MNKKHCSIVFDLLPGYIENDVTADTKEFVDEHLKECKNCQETLKNMKNNSIDEQMKIQDDSKIEIEKIKKVKRKFKTHKIILSISSIVILIIAIALLCNTIYNAFNKTLYDRIKEVYEENIKANNYYYSVTTVAKSYNIDNTFYYTSDLYVKDGKFVQYGYWSMEKNEPFVKNEPKFIEYGDIGINPFTKIDTYSKKIITMNFSREFNIITENYYSCYSYFENKDIEIKTFEEKEWYVYRTGDDKIYCEYWVSKDNLTDLRIIQSEDWNYSETTITLKKDIVTDENMKIEYDTTNYEYEEFPN